MEQLTELLNNIDDSYYDFTVTVLNYAKKKQSRLDVVTEYIKEHPKVSSSDVLSFIADQKDFYEDAVSTRAS